MQHGEGEWRSSQGDVYVGTFSRGVYDGHGRHADDRGNVYEGQFIGGAFGGVGTYTYADGRAECNRYEDGREIGEGVRWSPNRARAWQLHNGKLGSELNITAAAAIASALGLDVPRAGEGGAVFSPSPDSEARLRERLEEEDASGALGFDAYVAVDACDGVLPHGGALIAQSTRPLVTAEECERIIAECEARADTLGGWSTARHADECYATTDQPVRHLEQTAEWLRDSFLPDVAWPFVAHAFGFALQDARRDGAWPGVDGGSDAQEARAALRVSDAFVVKYNASAGQQGMMDNHRDGALFSLNIALNDLDEYEGGGTYFRKLDGDGGSDEDACGASLRSPKGHVIAHSSALMHGGHPTTKGVRYILVAFCTIAPEYAGWASRFYEHVNQKVDPGDEALVSERALPLGMLTAGPVYRQARQASLEGERAY